MNWKIPFTNNFRIFSLPIEDCTMPPTKRPIMEGSDDGEGYRWKTLKAKDGAIDVFYGHGSASRFQLKKADKKTAPTEQLVLQRIAEHRDAKRKQ